MIMQIFAAGTKRPTSVPRTWCVADDGQRTSTRADHPLRFRRCHFGACGLVVVRRSVLHQQRVYFFVFCAYGAVDIVIDTIGGDIQQRSFAALKPGDVPISSVQQPSAELAEEYHVRAGFFFVDVGDRVLDDISTMLFAKTIVPNVGLVLPLSQARKAHELLARPQPGMRGKIVLSTDDLADTGGIS
jgi:hypothetical protein